MDLETCGLAGSTIFLSGMLVSQEDTWQCAQLWARDYSEEKSILHTFWSMVSGHEVLVTFNGKSFDWPQIQARSTVHRLGRDPSLLPAQTDVVPLPSGTNPWRPDGSTPLGPGQTGTDTPPPSLAQLDLLHHARRAWKTSLPNCRLQTLERYLCGRARFDDIPGHLIPAAYHEYVQTGDTRQVRRILHHNALDLLTLLQITLRVMEATTTTEPARRRRAS